jgi:AraC-like DNA-binding protein
MPRAKTPRGTAALSNAGASAADEPATATTYSATILKLLRDNITPSVEKHGVSRVVLARPHLTRKELPEGISLSPRGPLGAAVRRRGYITHVIARWPEAEMEALSFPSLCFIYAGEADISIGDAILHCPRESVIVVPPGVPLTEGRTSHWFRPHLENASSDILWLNILPFGAHFHLCHTRGAQHESVNHSRLLERRLFPIAEQLMQELEECLPFSQRIAAAHLLTLLYLLQRHGSAFSTRAVLNDARIASYDLNDPAAIVERAQAHIESHLAHKLSLESIARAAYVSRARLTQLFRDELHQTVWDYVTARRLREAKVMLTETNMYIYDIARLCGFSHQSHFFARFIEAEGMTPREWRIQSQSHIKNRRA